MKKRRLMVFLAAAIGLALVLGEMPAVFAQEAGEDFTLEEITVTAQKRAENQQKVAMAMEVISSEQIKELGKTDIDEILSGVSNAIINRAADGLRVSIRGLGDTGRVLNGQSVSMPSVAVNMDGAMSNRKDTGSGLFDVERVEVLYGPQSTLYSSNSPGGIVNVVTANPKLDTYEASGLLEYGNFNLLHTEGTMNTPISSKVAIRAAFSTSVHDGYLSNGGANQDSKSARLRALFQASDKLSFVVTGELSKSSSHGYGSVQEFDSQDGYWYTTEGEGNYVKAGKVTDPWYSTDALGKGTSNKDKKISGRMDWDMGFGTLTVLPSYAKRRGADSFVMTDMGGNTTDSQRNKDTEEKSLELRMASSSESFLKWIVGATYYKMVDYQSSNSFYTDGTPTGAFSHVWMDEKLKAAFANITYSVTDTFRLTGGYRYSWDDLQNDVYETKGPQNQIGWSHFPDHNKAPDYKIGVEYDLGTNSMLYADYATSYRVQGMGGGGPPGTELIEPPPEKLKSFSVGSKNRFFDNRVQANASAYYYDYENYKAFVVATAWEYLDASPYPGDANYRQPMSDEFSFDPYSSGWGSGNMMGVDLQTSWLISAQDMLDLSVSYEKSEWTDLVFDYYYPYGTYAQVGGGPPGMVVEVTPVDSSLIVPLETVSFNGKPMTMTPEWSINLSYSHNFNLPNGGTLKAQVDERYKSEYRLSWPEAEYTANYQEAFHITNLSMTYTHSDGKWTLSVNGKNLENYAEKTGYMGGAVGQLTVGDPRTYSAVLSVRF